MDTALLYAAYVACPLTFALIMYILRKVTKYALSSLRRFLVTCVVGSTLAILACFVAWYVPLWARIAKAWLMNVGYSCAIDRARRESLLELYQLPGIGPFAAIVGPWFGMPSWGEVHLDFGPTCHLLDHYGLVPALSAPPMVLWFKWACYCVLVLSLPLVCIWCYILFCTLQIIRRSLSGWVLHADAPVLPFTLDTVTKEVKRMSEAICGEVSKIKPVDGHHIRLAHVRARTEQSCLQFLRRYTVKTRDIGGSLKRNQNLGADHHICYPNLDAADHRRAQLMTDFANDAGVHSGQECPCKSRLSIMSYTDFHLTRDDLCQAISSPTLIITHDFSAHKGVKKWYDGEATVEVNHAGVSMQSAGGSSYVHGYHHWGPEGVLISHDKALHYRRLGFVDKYTMVLLVWPSSGTYYRNDPLNLRSSAGMVAAADCSGGVTAVRTTVGDGKLVFSFRKGGEEIGQVPAATIIRSAHALSTLARGERYRATSDSIVRSRFVADEADLNLLQYATALVSQLSDEMATNTAYDSWITGSPSDLSWLHRRVLGLLIAACNRRGVLFSASRSIFLWFVGSNRQHSLTPWAWSDIRVPMYDVVPPKEKLETIENTSPSRPFPSGGQGDVAGPAPPNSDVPRQDSEQCSNLTPNTGVECGAPPPPPPPEVVVEHKPQAARKPRVPKPSTAKPAVCTEPTCAGKHLSGQPCKQRKPCAGICRHADGSPVQFHALVAKCRGEQPKPPAAAAVPGPSGASTSSSTVPTPRTATRNPGRRSTQTGGKNKPRVPKGDVQTPKSTTTGRKNVGKRLDKNVAASKSVRNSGRRRANPRNPRGNGPKTPNPGPSAPPPDVGNVSAGGSQPVGQPSESLPSGGRPLSAMAEPFSPATTTGVVGGEAAGAPCGPGAQACHC